MDDVKRKGFWRWLAVILLFVGRGTLFVIGTAVLIFQFYLMFEEDFSFWEISAVEVIFVVVFYYVCARHLRRCRLVGLGLVATLYRPVKNVAWSILASMVILAFGLIVGSDISVPDYSISASDQAFSNLLGMSIVLACIYWASPSVDVEKSNEDKVTPEVVV